METKMGKNRYTAIIENVFLSRYQEGLQEVPFERRDLVRAAETLGTRLPKNLGT